MTKIPTNASADAGPARILRVDASMRHAGSTTRALADRLIDRLTAGGAIPADLTVRDLAITPVPQIDEAWIAANFTPVEDRSADQHDRLAESDVLVREVLDADTVVIGAPVYNFGIPAALKAWIDQVVRARLTFRYTDQGPVGLVGNKRAFVIVASGGTPLDSEIDFTTPYLRHILGFLGIGDVTVIAADRLMADPDGKRAAEAAVDAVAPLVEEPALVSA